MAQPSPITQTITGTYNPTTRQYSISSTFRNDSTAAITALVYFVVTEDSIYYAAANGDLWHNHVARDYVPNQSGTSVTIAPGDSVTQTRACSLKVAWNADRCVMISWIQASGTRNVFQAGIQPITTLPVGIVEMQESEGVPARTVTVSPNPCVTGTRFRFSARSEEEYAIDLYDASGRLVRRMAGVCSATGETVTWDRRDDSGVPVRAGVYFYRVNAGGLRESGKIVVR